MSPTSPSTGATPPSTRCASTRDTALYKVFGRVVTCWLAPAYLWILYVVACYIGDADYVPLNWGHAAINEASTHTLYWQPRTHTRSVTLQYHVATFYIGVIAQWVSVWMDGASAPAVRTSRPRCMRCRICRLACPALLASKRPNAPRSAQCLTRV
jgi:hypothetical protein